MKEQFQELTFYASSHVLINQANEICREYLHKGYSLTLRQLYYQFVARDLLKNTIQNYKRLGEIINKARLAGLLDWDFIEDRTRWLHQIANYQDPEDFISNVINQYAENLWRHNPVYCEVWVEKDALSGVVARVCNEWRVPYFPCRGYGSQSEIYAAGKRLASMEDGDYESIMIFHLGDHDPSGIDMSRDNRERLEMFARRSIGFERIALNMDQIEEYDPPENPAKETDSRFAGYEELYGSSSWELDSMSPEVIHEIIERHILSVLDRNEFFSLRDEETDNRERLKYAADNWPDVVEFLKKMKDEE